MGMTAIEKILARASRRAGVKPGEIVHPDPEYVIVHDGYVIAAKRELDALGIDRVFDPDRVMFVTDHEVLYTSQAAALRGQAIRQAAKAWGINNFFDVGQGGHGHIFPMELGLIRPGTFAFAYDMHCTNFGAVGALVLRTGSEVTTPLVTGTIWTLVPRSIKIELIGRFKPGVYARDLGHRLAHDLACGAHGVDHDYKALEFGGPGLASLPLGERIALCNSVTEIGVCATFFPPDADILAWCHNRAAGAFTPVFSDADANYEKIVRYDLSALEPQVALPGGPQNAADLSTVVGRKVQHAYIGSCGSGAYEDLQVAASILAGRRVSPDTRLFITPGTIGSSQRMIEEGLARTFQAAGAIILPAGCGPCAGGVMGPLASGETSICTAATNNAGRMGAKDASIFLASPATVAASAVTGAITDPREILAFGSEARAS